MERNSKGLKFFDNSSITVLTQKRIPHYNEELWNNTNKILYGPVASRRMGESIGINLLPYHKVCSYNCIYCDVGFTSFNEKKYISYKELCDLFLNDLQNIYAKYKDGAIKIDYFTFCGNGENWEHPDFKEIYEFIVKKLNKHFPNIPTAILTNGNGLSDKEYLEIINQIDLNFIKLDAGDKETFLKINRPQKNISWEELISNLRNVNDLRLETAVVESPKVSNVDSLKGSYIDLVRTLEEEGNLKGIYLHNIDYPTVDSSLKSFSKHELIKLGEYISNHVESHVYILYSNIQFRKS